MAEYWHIVDQTGTDMSKSARSKGPHFRWTLLVHFDALFLAQSYSKTPKDTVKTIYAIRGMYCVHLAMQGSTWVYRKQPKSCTERVHVNKTKGNQNTH